MPAWSLLGLNHLSRAGLFQLTTTADVCLPDTAQRRCTASERLWQPTLRRCRPTFSLARYLRLPVGEKPPSCGFSLCLSLTARVSLLEKVFGYDLLNYDEALGLPDRLLD